jgi:predicted ribosomally synthesized peptide with SipW-like signal peptide
MSGKLPGLRAAIITYVLIVVLGLGGVAAHALWSQSGTVTVNLTAGHWAKPPGKVGNVSCTRGDTTDHTTLVTMTWEGVVDATKYELTARSSSSIPQTQTWIVEKSGEGVVSTPRSMQLPNNSGEHHYTLSITPIGPGGSGSATNVMVYLAQKNTTPGCTISA